MSKTEIEKADDMMDLFPQPPVLKKDDIILKPLSKDDASNLNKLINQKEVYQFLPAFLFEKMHEPQETISLLYDKCLKDSLILGIFKDEDFCGLMEVYGYKVLTDKVSIGYRLLKEKWNKGIGTKALKIMLDELINKRGIKIINASTMVDNIGSEKVLEKNGFILIDHGVYEDWGYETSILADKWQKTVL